MFSRILSRLRARRRCVGVDIGAASIKVVRIDVDGDQPRSIAACSRPTPRGVFEQYRIADPVAVGANLADALSEIGARDLPIAVALPAPAAMVRRLNVPRRELGAIAARVRSEMSTLIEDGGQDLAFDFQIVGNGGGGDTAEVLVVSARRDVVSSFSKTVGEARGHVAIADLDYFALQNAAEWSQPPSTRGTVLLLHVGPRYMALNLVAADRSAFTAAIEIGARGATLPSGEDPATLAVRSEIIQGICEDAHHTLNFYCSFLQERPLDSILLTGGFAHAPGLAEALSARIGAPVRCSSALPVGETTEWELARQPEFAIAAGLATRTAGDQ